MRGYEKIGPDSLFSWLAPLHVEGMSEGDYARLRQLFSRIDVQSKEGQAFVISEVLLPEFERANDISKQALKAILATAIVRFTDRQLEEQFWEAGMPFREPILAKREFLKNVWDQVFAGESPELFCSGQ